MDRTYDARNRLQTLTFPDGRGNQTWAYTADGLPSSITTYNDPGNGAPVINAYSYNRRRMLTGESIHQPGWYTWGTGYGYNANGHLANQSYPTGLLIHYSPNALGQPTHINDQFGGIYASGLSYYPNGSIRQFTYGNGVVHAMQRGARALPSRVTNSGVFDFTFAYDGNGNVTAINDVYQVPGQYSGSRDMQYDRLDRLTYAHLHWQQINHFTYDELDNIRSKTHFDGASTTVHNYWYDGKNQLTNVIDGGGASIVGMDYDGQATWPIETAKSIVSTSGIGCGKSQGRSGRTAMTVMDGACYQRDRTVSPCPCTARMGD